VPAFARAWPESSPVATPPNIGWTVAPVLSGWQPATTAQVQAVELWVDRNGNRGLASTESAGLRLLSRHVRRLEQRGETWLCVKTAEPPED
jgi:hypothetical protein